MVAQALIRNYGSVAQLVERLAVNQDVEGSSPSGAAKDTFGVHICEYRCAVNVCVRPVIYEGRVS